MLAQGATPQGKVAVYTYNCPAYLETCFATFKASLVYVNVNYRYRAEELEYLLDNAIFTVPAYPLWGGSALIGGDGRLLGVGSLLVQEALGPGAPAFPGNMYVPINRLKPIFGELVENGRLSTPPRPWLGVLTVEHMGQLVVGGVTEGGPADKAGVKPGDQVIGIGEDRVKGLAALFRRVWALGPAGVEVPLLLSREGDVLRVRIRSADRNDFLWKPRLH